MRHIRDLEGSPWKLAVRAHDHKDEIVTRGTLRVAQHISTQDTMLCFITHTYRDPLRYSQIPVGLVIWDPGWQGTAQLVII